MKMSELKTKTVEELKKADETARRALFDLRMQKGQGIIPKSHLIRQERRTLARIKTLLHEKRQTHE